MLFRICINCGDSKQVANRKLAQCLRCNNCQMEFRLHKYYRICQDCGNKKQVKNAELASAIRCKDCANIWKKTHPPKHIKSNKQKKKIIPKSKKPMSAEAIEVTKKINREHRQKMKNIKIISEPSKTTEEMIKDFLNNNVPSITLKG